MMIRGAPGNRAVFRQIRQISERINRGIADANKKIGVAVSNEAKRTMLYDPKTGKKYIEEDIWTGKLFLHQASKWGESPAKLSGSLIASTGYVPSAGLLVVGAGTVGGNVPIVKDLSNIAKQHMPGQIGFGRIVDYAARLELVMNRPFLKPSIQKFQAQTYNYYAAAVMARLLRKIL